MLSKFPIFFKNRKPRHQKAFTKLFHHVQKVYVPCQTSALYRYAPLISVVVYFGYFTIMAYVYSSATNTDITGELYVLLVCREVAVPFYIEMIDYWNTSWNKFIKLSPTTWDCKYMYCLRRWQSLQTHIAGYHWIWQKSAYLTICHSLLKIIASI